MGFNRNVPNGKVLGGVEGRKVKTRKGRTGRAGQVPIRYDHQG